jgi:hypothetical protein
MIELFIVLIIIAILAALGWGLLGMLKGGKQGSDKMFKSIVTRVVLSLTLFALVMFAAFMGWIEQNNVILDAADL